MAVSVQNQTRSALGGARRAFSRIAAEILPGWEISLVFVSAPRAKELNETLRGKTYTPNVLSYVAGVKNGEIIICPQVVKKEAPLHEMSEKDFVLYLFIHGVLHIKGWAHGARMEACEQKLLAHHASGSSRSLSHGTKNRNRDRHRDVPGKNGRRRGTL